MIPTDENISKNRSYYNMRYSKVNLEAQKRKVLDYENFLDDVTQTDGWWAGLYYGGFKERINGAKVLELGCGAGLNALIMAMLGADVVATDISEVAVGGLVNLIQELQISSKISALSGHLRELSLTTRSFDFIVGRGFLSHLNHESEDGILSKASQLLTTQGEARFLEPAVNSNLLDRIQWLIPAHERPSILQRRAFSQWKEVDPHPVRDNSSKHYFAVGKKYFEEVEIIPYGGIERFYRVIPQTKLRREFRRWALRLERRLPKMLNLSIATGQTIIYRKPRSKNI
jgi:2-polyprenyl-3-methyl-5-hydroxy-6-metoxy-1,4-benzoquinol methylase